MKSIFLHAREGQKIGPEPKVHVPRSKWQRLGWKTENGQFLTLGHMGTPLNIKILKIGLRDVLSWSRLGLDPKCKDPGTFGGFRKTYF